MLLNKKTTKINKKYDGKEKNVKVSGSGEEVPTGPASAASLGQCGRAEGYMPEGKELV